MRWRFEPRVAWQSVADDVIVMDVKENRAIGLNASGSFIWMRVSEHDDEEIARQLAAAFAIDPADALRDVRAFLEEMRTRGLVAPAE